jgi:choline dehydrogenase-like flavoprotein
VIVAFESWIRSPLSKERADVCVIGGGPAGIEIANTLARNRVRVLVLEAGDRSGSEASQAGYEFHETGLPLLGAGKEFRAAALGAAADRVRMRCLGGTSAIWSGKWKLPDAIDFEDRPWVSSARWPSAWPELEPFARDVMRDYGVPVRALLRDFRRGGARGLGGLRSVRHFEEAMPCRFAEKHAAMLDRSAEVCVVTGAGVLALEPDGSRERVASVTVGGADGAVHRIAAREFVLAVGGIETARVLLASRGFGEAGAGNEHGHVGRGFMDHPKVRIGKVDARGSAAADFLCGSPAERHRGVFRRVTLEPAMQRALRVPNHALGFHTTEAPRARWRSLLRPRARMVGPLGAILFLEQTENTRSRVRPSARCDAWGYPLAEVHWALSDADAAGVQRFVEAVRPRMEEALGAWTFDAIPPPEAWTSGSHHMATARMATSASSGVVDRECRVFSIHNLHVAGTAVFPVGGNANPMILLLALARRLAARLVR